MIFAVDAGNTHITIGCLEGKCVKSLARIETNTRKTEYEYAAVMDSIVRRFLKKGGNLDGAVLSSVVPNLTKVLCSSIELSTGLKPIKVGSGIKTGLNIGIDDPGQLGADLVCAAVGALDMYEPPIIIIDLGTATTMTVIDKNSRFLGGAILPGINISAASLASETSQLPRVSIIAPKRCISTNTVECIQSGVVFGHAAAIDGLIDKMQEELGYEANLLATGGLSTEIIPNCKHKIDIEPDLLLKGLSIIWEKNKDRF